MTRLSLKNSPVELQRPYSAKDGDIPSRKADAQNCYVYSGHLEPCSITFAYYKHGFTLIDIHSIAHSGNNINSLWNICFNIYRLFIV